MSRARSTSVLHVVSRRPFSSSGAVCKIKGAAPRQYNPQFGASAAANDDAGGLPGSLTQVNLAGLWPSKRYALEQERADCSKPANITSFRTIDPDSPPNEGALPFDHTAVHFFLLYGLPPAIQRHLQYFRRYPTVRRQFVTDIAANQYKTKTPLFLHGTNGSGKSTTLMQLIAHAAHQNHPVMYIPHASTLIDSSQAFTYNDQKGTYDQPALAQLLLEKFDSANRDFVKNLEGARALVHGGLENATERLTKFFELLANQPTPILLAVDNAQSLFRTSSYLDSYGQPLQAFDLPVPKILLDVATKPSSIKTIFASSKADAEHQSQAFDYKVSTPANLYAKQGHPIYKEVLDKFELLEVPSRLEMSEAKAILENLAKANLLREALTDSSLMFSYIAAGGNAGQLIKQAMDVRSTAAKSNQVTRKMRRRAEDY